MFAHPGGSIRRALSSPTRPLQARFNYKGGQYVFLCIPRLSTLEWHPFSLSSSPSDDFVCIHVRVLGNWTRRLFKLAQKKQRVTVFFEGPYGEPGIDLDGDKYDHIMLISGGIGVTPMQSICNELVEQHGRGRPLKLLWFVWAVADRATLEAVAGIDAADSSDTEMVSGSDAIASVAENPQGLQANGQRALPLSFQPPLIRRQSVSSVVARYQVQPEGDDTTAADDLKHRKGKSPKKNKPKKNRGGGVGVSPEAAVILDNSIDELHTEFFLTRVRDSSEFDAAGISPEIQPTLRFGRPDVPKMFETMRTVALSNGAKRVAVCVCGPPPLVASTREQCDKHSGCELSFDYHTETFDF
jgi:NAD(P)H-flavin reductase